MLAAIPSATLLGVDGLPVRVEVHVVARPTWLHRRRLARRRLPRVARSRARRGHVVRSVVAEQTHHRQPGAEWPTQDRRRARSPDRARRPRRGRRRCRSTRPVGIGVDRRARPRRSCSQRSRRRVHGAGGRRVGLVVPATSHIEAGLVDDRHVRSVSHLRELIDALRGRRAVARCARLPLPPTSSASTLDMADIHGQHLGRFAVEVAAAGGHHLLLLGPPGSGKTMLARRIPGLLPPLTSEQALETTRAHSAAGLALPPGGLVTRPPWRAPHHSASVVGLVGGGGARLAAGRDLVRDRRRVVPRRVGGVRDAGARSAAPAAGGGRHSRDTGGCVGHVPGALPPRRRDEPLPVRQRRTAGLVSLHRVRPALATSGDCPGRSWTASTFDSPCTDPRRPSWWPTPAENRRQWSPHASPRCARLRPNASGTTNAAIPDQLAHADRAAESRCVASARTALARRNAERTRPHAHSSRRADAGRPRGTRGRIERGRRRDRARIARRVRRAAGPRDDERRHRVAPRRRRPIRRRSPTTRVRPRSFMSAATRRRWSRGASRSSARVTALRTDATLLDVLAPN